MRADRQMFMRESDLDTFIDSNVFHVSKCPVYGGFHKWGTPLSLDGLFHGRSITKMDDLGVPLL